MIRSAVHPTPPAAPSAAAWGAARGIAWQAMKLALAALLAYALWRGYQNPDLLLDYAAAWRLC